MKARTIKAVALVLTFLVSMPHALAAQYFLSEHSGLVKGCSGTVEIRIDTQGSGIVAGDSTINISSSEVAVNQVSIGSSLPMQVFNQFTADQIKLSGARLPLSGTFNGNGTFGYINFTPTLTANTVSLNFSPDLTIDNNLVDDSINNVLTAAVSKTYTVRDRYNTEVDGVGFCTPDVTPPTVQYVTPPSGSANNPVDTNIIFSLSDNRTGVNITTLDFTIGGISYDENSPQVTVTEDNGVYRVETDPDADFSEGQLVQESVTICDQNVPANCTTRNGSFRIFTPAPPPPVCGDGILSVGNGEQCDDGNLVSGDGCSSLCLFEAPQLPDPSCSDGRHNGSETGIDCGGSCPNACPTCVDGILNQGEEGVDCGGPCPSCDDTPVVCEVQEFNPVTICFYPGGESESYSLAIPDYELSKYIMDGHTVGPCSDDELVPVAPEVEDKAKKDAEDVEQQEKVIETITVQPEAPENVEDQIEICKAIPEYQGANFDDPRTDTDSDGLSDRTECYLKTSPLKPDTDADGCSDGDEINQFNTDPLDGEDCSVVPEEQKLLEIILTDPKPNWTMGILNPRFAGIAPLDATAVTVTAFQADQKFIKAINEDLNNLLQAKDAEKALAAVNSLEGNLNEVSAFLEGNRQDYDYVELEEVVTELVTRKDQLKAQLIATTSFTLGQYFAQLQDLAIGNLLLELKTLQREPVVAGSSNQFSETFLGNDPANRFEFVSQRDLDDRKLYNVVATATVEDETISSNPIRIGVNSGFTINRPIPRTLGGKNIPQEGVTLNGFISEAYAQGSGRSEILIDEERPTVTGDSEFGSQVFAIWNSVVLSSSVISDSEQGAFEIQAPRNLEKGVPHRVTLYAVKTDGESTVRSDSVDVYFKIREGRIGFTALLLAAIAIALLIGGIVVFRRLQTQSVINSLNLEKYKDYQNKR